MIALILDGPELCPIWKYVQYIENIVHKYVIYYMTALYKASLSWDFSL